MNLADITDPAQLAEWLEDNISHIRRVRLAHLYWADCHSEPGIKGALYFQFQTFRNRIYHPINIDGLFPFHVHTWASEPEERDEAYWVNEDHSVTIIDQWSPILALVFLSDREWKALSDSVRVFNIMKGNP